MVTVRRAIPADADAMCAVINPIIAAGGTTAHEEPFDAARMIAWNIAPEGLVSCMVAEVESVIRGFQVLTREDDLPQGWAGIGSFVAVQGRGIGQHLWRATQAAARVAGVATIDATIRADNVPGLAYYSGLGFTDYDVIRAVPLRDGRPVDRIRKRFDLGQGPKGNGRTGRPARALRH